MDIKNVRYPEKRCPACKSDKLLDGPRGGMSQNIYCVDCQREWNYSPIGFEPIIPARHDLYPYKLMCK